MKQIINRLHSKGVVLAATLLAVVTLVLTPAAASAQSVVTLGNNATLIARGAAIVVPVTVACDTGSTVLGLTAQVTQRSGKRLAQASGSAPTVNVTCNGAPQVVDIFMHAQIAGAPFNRGSAAASANFVVCEPSPSFACRGVSTWREITIR
jgi:hypothetical protein